MKCGIACKIGVDAQKEVNLLTFDILMFDFASTSRHAPLGCARTIHTQERFTLVLSLLMLQDWSNYRGNQQTLPTVTTFDLPSWSLFSDGIYPPSYPLNPTPPQTPLQPLNNQGRQYPLNQRELAIDNQHINLVNGARRPITIDFQEIADAIREITW